MPCPLRPPQADSTTTVAYQPHRQLDWVETSATARELVGDGFEALLATTEGMMEAGGAAAPLPTHQEVGGATVEGAVYGLQVTHMSPTRHPYVARMTHT